MPQIFTRLCRLLPALFWLGVVCLLVWLWTAMVRLPWWPSGLDRPVSFALNGPVTTAAPAQFQPQNADEIKQILATQNLADQKILLQKLLARVGPEQAQELMYRSGMPFTGQTHLLIHTIGEYIYEHDGPAGLKYCKEYFLSACYHAFIIDDLADHGLDGVAETVGECEKSGMPVLSQCAHAAGHGFLAWRDYDVVGALKMCDQLGQRSANIPMFNCYDGVFMENFWGVHDGSPSPKRWIKNTDAYYPCTDSRIPEKYLPACWANQATVMYTLFNSDLKKVAAGCDGVQNQKYREMCYNNFARQIHPLTNGNTADAFRLCQNATGKTWQTYCLVTLVESAFSVGDHERMPYEICAQIDDESKPMCYQHLNQIISAYYGSTMQAVNFCKNIRDQKYQQTCTEYQGKGVL